MSTGEEHDHGGDMGKSIMKGIAGGIPVTYLVMVVGFWLLLDRNFARALETAALPALLTGAFFGGFAGISAFELSRARQERAARSDRR